MVVFNTNRGLVEHILLGLLVVLAVMMFAVYAVSLPWRFNSPDEAANAYFTQRVADGDAISAPDTLNQITINPIVHPRSTLVINDKLAPASFLGLPLLLGFIGRVAGNGILPFITPLAATIGLLSFFFIVKELSGKKAAWIGLVLLIFTPAYWYYHSRSFFHNAIFVDLTLLTIWAAFLMIRKPSSWRYLFTGLCFGTAVAVRSSEVFWLSAAGLIFLLLNWRQIKWKYLGLILVGSMLAFLPVLISNYQIYGSIFSIGYKTNLGLPTRNLSEAMGLVWQLVIPFGLHPQTILSTVTNYLFKINWWWSLLVLSGSGYLIIKWPQHSKQAKFFALTTLVICLWLIIVYGSWQFNDNPDPSKITLGTSYARYWLPIYVLGLWPASLMLSRIIEKKWGKEIVYMFMGIYLVLSTLLVWWEPQEGLVQVKSNIIRFEQWNQSVQLATETNSVIVAGMTDKIFWPERQVIFDLVNPADYQAVVKLLQAQVPVYWFHPTWLSKDLVTVNNRLANQGLKVEVKKFGWQDFSLYKFKLSP